MFLEPGGARPSEADAADLDAVLEIERLAVWHDDLARNHAQFTLFAAVTFDHITGADRKSARELAYSHESLSYRATSDEDNVSGHRSFPNLWKNCGDNYL